MKVLFICNQNRHRSKTAEKLFRPLFETKSAGLFCSPSLTESELAWADLVIVMEDFQRKEISQRYSKLYLQKQIISLKIPDLYAYNQPELITLLNKKFKRALSIHHIA